MTEYLIIRSGKSDGFEFRYKAVFGLLFIAFSNCETAFEKRGIHHLLVELTLIYLQYNCSHIQPVYLHLFAQIERRVSLDRLISPEPIVSSLICEIVHPDQSPRIINCHPD